MSFLYPDMPTWQVPDGPFELRDWQMQCLRAFRVQLAASDKNLPFQFVVTAGVGSGKTAAAAAMCVEAKNAGVIHRVIYVCPNDAIRRAVRDRFQQFGICLSYWDNSKGAAFDPKEPQFGQDGWIVNYQSLSQQPAMQRAGCSVPTMVVFDEIHHLGDSLQWGNAARDAFDGVARVIVGLSGTPWRTDGQPIPFTCLEHVPASTLFRLRSDYAYTLGRAVADGVCREPYFHLADAIVDVPKMGRLSFNDNLNDEAASRALSGAIRPGCKSRLDLLRPAVERCLDERRRMIIFVGGDSSAPASDGLPAPTADAKTYLPDDLMSLGLGIQRSDIVSVYADNKSSQKLLDRFKDGHGRFLISINMVSEGVDIPDLSCAVFLTSITAKSTTMQRIGRVLRGREFHELAWVYMFKHPRYQELALEIKGEIGQEIALRDSQNKKPITSSGDGNFRRRPEYAVGISAEIDTHVVNGNAYGMNEIAAAREYMLQRSMPMTDVHQAVVLDVLRSQRDAAS